MIFILMLVGSIVLMTISAVVFSLWTNDYKMKPVSLKEMLKKK